MFTLFEKTNTNQSTLQPKILFGLSKEVPLPWFGICFYVKSLTYLLTKKFKIKIFMCAKQIVNEKSFWSENCYCFQICAILSMFCQFCWLRFRLDLDLDFNDLFHPKVVSLTLLKGHCQIITFVIIFLSGFRDHKMCSGMKCQIFR